MANTFITTNMLLELPDVEVQLGPEWAENINDAFGKVDLHDHSSGKGVQIPSSGININASLPFNGNNAITLRAASFQNSVSTLPNTDVRALYASGGNLYYNNNSGVPIQITSGTSINTGALAVNIWQYQAITSSLSIPNNATYVYLCVTASTGPKTITLPLASSVTAGRYYIVKDKNGVAGANPISITPTGTNSIEGLVSFTEVINYNYGSVIFISDGVSNWQTFKQGSPGATSTTLGTVRLAGDLAGTGSTFNTPRVIDATVSQKGKIQLAGDLNGDTSSSATPTIGKLTGISGGVSMGATPATSTNNIGVRLSNSGSSTINSGITIRNNTNTANVNIASMNGFNEVRIGDDLNNTRYYGGHRVKTTLVSGSGNYNIDSVGGKDYIILCNPTSILQLMLPPGEIGREFIIKDISGTAAINQIQVYNSDGKTIEGVTIGLGSTITLMANYGAWRFVCDGNGNWWVL